MINFDKHVLIVLIEEIFRDMRALCHPVQPEPATSAVNAVVRDFNVNGAVKLDARHLRTSKRSPHVNVANRVMRDFAERCAHAADDACLATIRNCVIADNRSEEHTSEL